MKKSIVICVLLAFVFTSFSMGLDASFADKDKKKDEKKLISGKKMTGDPIVYIKEKTGKKYHKKNCKLVSTGKIGIKLSEAKKKGLKPCAICFKKTVQTGQKETKKPKKK